MPWAAVESLCDTNNAEMWKNLWLMYDTEVDRAVDNLAKSGKMGFNLPGRRESTPMSGGPPPREFQQQFGTHH